MWYWVPRMDGNKEADVSDVKWSQKRVLPKIELDQQNMFDGWFYRQVGGGAIVPLTSSLPAYFDCP